MQIGTTFPQNEFVTDPGAVRDFAQAAEGAGFDYLVAYDHVLGADPTKHDLGGPYTHESMFHEPFVLFGYMAGLTERIQLVTAIIILPQRQTALVAKQAAEVDVLSGGRLTLGIGIGWNHVEYEGLGQDFRTRGRRSEEQVQLIRQLWEQPLVTFEGEFDTIRDAGIHPRPERRIPIWFGGGADSVLRRIGQYGDGWLTNVGGSAEELRATVLPRLERIREVARAAGRDAEAIALIGRAGAAAGPIDAQVAEARDWEELGATHATFNGMNAGLRTPQQHIDAMTAFAEAYRASA